MSVYKKTLIAALKHETDMKFMKIYIKYMFLQRVINTAQHLVTQNISKIINAM